MAIYLAENESVRRDGESWSIGDKVYAPNYGMVYIQSIEVLGVHFGFRAEVEGCLVDGTTWLDSRVLEKEPPDDVLKDVPEEYREDAYQ